MSNWIYFGDTYILYIVLSNREKGATGRTGMAKYPNTWRTAPNNEELPSPKQQW